MNENIDLCKILKGHEGETFYSPAFGDVKLEKIEDDNHPVKEFEYIVCYYMNNKYKYPCTFSKDGKVSNEGECMLFPSKDQIYWDIWMEEQKTPIIPKTWNEFCKNYEDCECFGCSIDFTNYGDDCSGTDNDTQIEKSALAFLKIYQIIEVGYGGFPITEYKLNLNNTVYVPDYWPDEKKWSVCAAHNSIDQIAFYKEEQCEEFLSYPENIQLLEEFYML